MRGKLSGNVWQVAFTYAGTLIGAGFASGQEILKFFAVYEKWGVLGALAAGGMFAALGYLIVETASMYEMESYNQYVNLLFGKRMAGLVDGVIALFLMAGLTIMLIASGSLLSDLLSCPIWWGFGLTVILIWLILLTGVQGLLRLNAVLVPLLLVILLTILAINLGQPPVYLELSHYRPVLLGGSWFLASMLYVAYNLVLGTVILSSLGKKAGIAGARGALLGGLFLGIILALVCSVLIRQGGIVAGKEMPMLELARNTNSLAGKAYLLVLWLAIITTALSNAHGILMRLVSWGKFPRKLAAFVIFLPSLMFLEWPFVKAVETFYPVLGYLGMILLVFIILKSGKRRGFFF